MQVQETSYGIASTICASARNILRHSIDHVCKCKERYHPHPTPPDPNPFKNQTSAFRTTADYKPGSNYLLVLTPHLHEDLQNLFQISLAKHVFPSERRLKRTTWQQIIAQIYQKFCTGMYSNLQSPVKIPSCRSVNGKELKYLQSLQMTYRAES